MNGDNDDVIDLTDSFRLIDHWPLADVIIELDDSNPVFPPDSPPPQRRNSIRRPKVRKTSMSKKYIQRSSSNSPQNNRNKSSKGIGDCPVCWDELGKNPLGSTKCGHIFCLHCIKQVVKQTKSCPTCRCSLKGSTAYHPIYLALQ